MGSINKVRWGIVGPGRIAHQFAHDIQFTSNAELVAVASNNLERAESFANKFGLSKYYQGYQPLCQDPGIDAIYVATTHNFHLQNSIEALNEGKAVLCEKPLTDNLNDAIKLVNAATMQNKFLMEAMWTYFLPAVREAKTWVDEGRIGKVVNLKANFGYHKAYDPLSRAFNPELSGGVLLDMGIYPVAMAWLFMQDDPGKYNIVAEKVPTGVDHDVNMQLIYSNNRIANLHTSFKVKLNNYCHIIGEKGYIEIPDFWRANEITLYQGDEIIDQYKDNRKGLGFEFQIEAASNDILNGRLQNSIMPHATSIKLQGHMQNIMQNF